MCPLAAGAEEWTCTLPKGAAYCGANVPPGLETCRATFEQVLAREYADAAYGATHLLSVDAYALQHSEEHGPRSNAFHLMRLCILLEHGGDPRIGAGPARAKSKAWEPHYRQFPFLEPPTRRGAFTIADVYGAPDSQEHSEPRAAVGLVCLGSVGTASRLGAGNGPAVQGRLTPL